MTKRPTSSKKGSRKSFSKIDFEKRGYISKKDLYQCKPIAFSDRNEYLLQDVGWRCRGFGYRHWVQIHQFMIKEKYSKEMTSHIKVSFFKFKLLRALCPQASNDLIWIFKHLLSLDGQKMYKECYELTLDTSPTKTRDFLSRKYPRESLIRITDYFYNTPKELWVSYGMFPLIFFKKSRMSLAFLDEPVLDLPNIKDLIRRYLFKLNLDELFVPPPDILYKIGNQLFNDSGEPKQDYNRAKKYNSGFLYQEFMAQPLQPREVWLPGKKLKHNNLFWMIICRQFLKRDPTYPSPDPEVLFERMRNMGPFFRFDISGFGFQYPRPLLKILVEIVMEMYPCSLMDIMGEELLDLLDEVVVEMPDGEKVRPPRGIGLGYYEDLKTIVMLAILDKYEPWSVYGDQGLLRSESGWDAIMDLISSGFIFSSDDKIQASSTTDTSEWKVKWAGYEITPHSINQYMEYSQKLVNVLFVEEHWERKNGLFSFYKEHPDFYRLNQKVIQKMYKLFFGYEFYEDEVYRNFTEIGISCTAPITVGIKKDFRVEKLKVPYQDTLFEAPYITPFKRRSGKAWPKSIGREFSRKRQRVFNSTPMIDSSVHYYVYPRLEVNNKYIPKERLLPEWAEYLYIALHNSSSGSFTYNMPEKDMWRALQNYSLHVDPLFAFKSGGYKILDMWHRRSVPTMEWSDAVTVLSNVEKRSLDYIQRADLPTSIMWADDPLYRSSDLYTYSHLKRKAESELIRPEADIQSKEFEEIGRRLIQKTKDGKISYFTDLVREVIQVENFTTEDEYIFDDELVEIEDFDVEAIHLTSLDEQYGDF